MTLRQTAAQRSASATCIECDGHHEDDVVAEQIGTDSASWLKRRVLGAILFYQRVREGKPSPCRFFPSCSAYALEAVAIHGTWRGGWLSVRRLARCRPLGPSGFDPVPERGPALPIDHLSPHLNRSDDVVPLSLANPSAPPVQKGG